MFGNLMLKRRVECAKRNCNAIRCFGLIGPGKAGAALRTESTKYASCGFVQAQPLLAANPLKLHDSNVSVTAAGCTVLFLTHGAMAVTAGYKLTDNSITNGATKTAARIRHVRFPHIGVLSMVLEILRTERSKSDLCVPHLKIKTCF